MKEILQPRSKFIKEMQVMNPLFVLFIVIIFSCILYFLWISFILPLICKYFSITTDTAKRIGYLSNAASFILSTCAYIFVIMQISSASKKKDYEIFRDIYEKMMDDKQIEYRRFIYEKINIGEPKKESIKKILMNAENRHVIKEVINLLDYYGFLLMQSWIQEKEVIDWMSPIVVKVWKKIGDIVDYEVKRREGEPDYYRGARYLANECFKWREKHYEGMDKIIFRKDVL